MIDQTRRGWLITISQAAAGLGAAEKIMAGAVDAPTLPPGVYQGSPDHLSHALMSADRYHPIPPGCPTDYVRPTNGAFEPQFFSKAEFTVIRRLTELLLGEIPGDSGAFEEIAEWVDLRVSTAGGVRAAAARLDPLYRTLAVAYFGSARVERVATENPGETSREGLDWILAAAHTTYAKEFISLTGEQQTAILRSISDERSDPQIESPGTRFFAFMKAETIRGFYTSRAGLKELDFKGNAFYARSPGCRA
jgi:hypothetical protein